MQFSTDSSLLSYLKIDGDGFLINGEMRLNDAPWGKQVLAGLFFNENGSLATLTKKDQTESSYLIEAFDQPLVVQNVEILKPDLWQLTMPYEYQTQWQLSKGKDSLFLDEWDRILGWDIRGIPFVLSRQAQHTLFDQLTSFDDESITIDDFQIPTQPWFTEDASVDKSHFWNDLYEKETPPWELSQPTPALTQVLPQLKLPRTRIAVLGCGSGEDAAYLANQGHIVTAFDFSPLAIEQAKKKFANTHNLTFEQADVFNLPEIWNGKFNLVFEHTFFCAISPAKRNELVKIWKRILAPGGQVLGVFFVNSKQHGPPFGGSEWEIQQRLTQLNYRLLYWTRWRLSIESRKGKELVVFAEKPR